MNIKRTLLAAVASVLVGTEALAGTYGWDASDNSTLFTSFKNYMKTMQTELVGEPLYFMAQQLLVDCEASFSSSPYAWLGLVHRFCNMAESIYGPAASHPRALDNDKYARIRKALLHLRDYPMHEVSLTTDAVYPPAEQRTAFNYANQQWLNEKRKHFLAFLASPRPTGKELQINKLYSSGVVFRTKNACIGIDICYNEAFGTTEGVSELASALDVLYVTHAHGDHYDNSLVTAMLNLGKPVVMPKNIFGTNKGTEVIWSTTQATKTLLGGVANTAAVMSAQGEEPCLLYHIDIDGWRIIHVGDNSHHENEPQLANYAMADVVVAPIFQGLTTLFWQISGASNPDNAQQFYLSIHENEFHHTIGGRVSYKYLYSDAGALGSTSNKYPCTLLMDNGEHIVLVK